MAEQSGNRPHVVVIGGGFAGIAAVRKLARAPVDVTLIDRHTYNTFSPLLYQVATASLNPGDITWFLRGVRARQRNVRFLKGRVDRIDHGSRALELAGGNQVSYDFLVIAVGVTTNYFGVLGAQENALPLYRRSQALTVRDRIFASLEDAAINGQDRDLRIAVVGGGATGVETSGALAEMRNNDLPTTYPELDRSRIHIALIEMQDYVLAPFHPSLRDYAARSLRERDIDLRLGTAVKRVDPAGVLLESSGKEEFLPAEIVIWASGITAHPVVADWGLPQGRGGRIEVDEHCRVPGRPGVFAIGDVSINPDDPLPQLAAPAIQGGEHVAKYIAADLSGELVTLAPFKYHDRGTMATIGRSSAIAQIKGLPDLTGFPAWIIWVFLHIALLLGNRNRFATMINLAAKYLTRSSTNAIVGETPTVTAQNPRRLGGG